MLALGSWWMCICVIAVNLRCMCVAVHSVLTLNAPMDATIALVDQKKWNWMNARKRSRAHTNTKLFNLVQPSVKLLAGNVQVPGIGDTGKWMQSECDRIRCSSAKLKNEVRALHATTCAQMHPITIFLHTFLYFRLFYFYTRAHSLPTLR